MEEDVESFADKMAQMGEVPSDPGENLGARPKVLTDVIDDSPLQNQIQKNKEGNIIASTDLSNNNEHQ
jgi:hypothetical protein